MSETDCDRIFCYILMSITNVLCRDKIFSLQAAPVVTKLVVSRTQYTNNLLISITEICLFPFGTFFVLFESRVAISFHQQRIKIWVSMNLEASMLSTSSYLFDISKGPTKAS